MEENKKRKIIKWCSLAPFIITFIWAFILSLTEEHYFIYSRMSASDSFVVLIMYAVYMFWWLYLIAIVGLVYVYKSSRKTDESLDE